MSDQSQAQPVDVLAFDNQVCFPLYSAANAVVRAYREPLARLDLTYVQYMVMLILWERGETSFKHVADRTRLDSGTLTPVLKRLEGKGLKPAPKRWYYSRRPSSHACARAGTPCA